MTSVLCISDNLQNNLVIADLEAMTIHSTTSVGRSPYPVDIVDADAVLVSTRGETSVDLVKISDGSQAARIALTHKPRSATRHASRALALISGADVARFFPFCGDGAFTTALFNVRVEEAKRRSTAYLAVDVAPMSRPILMAKGFHYICETIPYRRKANKSEHSTEWAGAHYASVLDVGAPKERIGGLTSRLRYILYT